MNNVIRIILAGCLILVGIQVKAQVLETKQQTKPDSLTIVDRLALRTNTVDWLLLMPNISAEFDLGSKNHNHWAVGLGLRYNWQTKHDYKPAWVYNLAEIRGELRYYWHTQKINKDYNINPHEKQIITDDTIYTKKRLLGRIFSTRRYELKHPQTTYYRGVYVSADKYSYLFGGGTGRQGTALIAGVLYGVVKPLYEFKNGNTLDLDLGFNVGVAVTKYDKYYHDRESDCYPVLAQRSWRPVPFPLVSELRCAFIYRLGRYPLTKKYRWRIDVDAKYRDEQQAIATAAKTELTDRSNLINEIRDIRKKFDEYYKEALDLPDARKKAKEDIEKMRKDAEKNQQRLEAEQARKQAEKETKKNKTPKEEKPTKSKKNKKEETVDTLVVPVRTDSLNVPTDSLKVPVAPVDSVTQETPETPEDPVNPETQETQETQDTPEKQETPSTPENSESSETPETPEQQPEKQAEE